MRTVSGFPNRLANGDRNPPQVLLTILASSLIATLFLLWVHHDARYISGGHLDISIWLSIPTSALFWGIFRWNLRPLYVRLFSFLGALLSFTWWAIRTPSLNGVGDLVNQPKDFFYTMVWFLLLTALMSLIDQLWGSKNLEKIGIAFMLVLMSYSNIPSLDTRQFVRSQIGIWINGVLFLALGAWVCVVTIETIFLLSSEFRKK